MTHNTDFHALKEVRGYDFITIHKKNRHTVIKRNNTRTFF